MLERIAELVPRFMRRMNVEQAYVEAMRWYVPAVEQCLTALDTSRTITGSNTNSAHTQDGN